jgi:hypothetical protein
MDPPNIFAIHTLKVFNIQKYLIRGYTTFTKTLAPTTDHYIVFKMINHKQTLRKQKVLTIKREKTKIIYYF